MKKKTVKVLGLATATLGTMTVGSLAPGGAAYADDPFRDAGSGTEYSEDNDTRSADEKAAAWNWCWSGEFCFGSGHLGSGDHLAAYNVVGAMPSNLSGLNYCGGNTWKNCASSAYNRAPHTSYTANNYNGTGSPKSFSAGEVVNALNSTLNNNIEYVDT